MPDCCYGDEYGSMFGAREANGKAARFHRQGLRGSAQWLAKAVTAATPAGSSLLEVGGGLGQIQVALLENGTAANAINIDMSPNWEAAAQQLLTQRGLDGRVVRIVGNFLDLASTLPAADVVLLHRVVCCYPHWQALLAAAAAKANAFLGLTFPADRWWNRVAIHMGNQTLRFRRRSFRGFVHPVEEMIAFLRSAGFMIVDDQVRPVWRNLLVARNA